MASDTNKDEKESDEKKQEEIEEKQNEEGKTKPSDSEEDKKKVDEEEEERKHRLESFRKAGEIHKKVVEFIKPKIKVGTKYLDICEKIEDKIFELGGEIGFPPNISVNDIACHYTSPPDDESVIKDGDVVKIDVGVAVDGFVADGAFTVSFNDDSKTENLIVAVETAVLKGLNEIQPGVKINKIGKITS